MKIGVRNRGKKTIPALGGDDHGRRPGRRNLVAPVRYPRPPARHRAAGPAGLGARRGLSEARRLIEAGGTQSLSRKTFDFGPLKPGATIEGVWKLSAVKAGRLQGALQRRRRHRRRGEGGDRRRSRPGGSFAVKITKENTEMEVTDSGEVVEIAQKGRRQAEEAG